MATESRSTRARSTDSPDRGHRNEVTLVGRLAGEIRERVMPSGALLASFRVVVRRDGTTQGPSIDTLDCVVWLGPIQRTISRWSAGDLIGVRGAVRRRFWRGGAGSVSRCEIEVGVARRLARTTGVPGPRRRDTRELAAASTSTGFSQRAGPMFLVLPTSSA